AGRRVDRQKHAVDVGGEAARARRATVGWRHEDASDLLERGGLTPETKGAHLLNSVVAPRAGACVRARALGRVRVWRGEGVAACRRPAGPCCSPLLVGGWL